MNKKQILLLAIILVGTFLRFYNIGSESFWLDEGATALTIKKYNAKEIFYNTATVGQILPGYYISNLDLPTYYVLLKFWTNVFGVNEVSIRLLSAIFEVFSIIVIYFLSKELFNANVGVISALIFSLNVVMIEYSQEARLYSFLIFITLLSGYFLIKYINTNKNSYLIAFTLSNVFGIYTHYPFLFFLIFEAAYILYPTLIDIKKRKIKIKNIHLSLLILFIAYLPLLPRLLNPKLVAAHFTGSFSIDKLVKIFLQFNSWFYPSLELRYKLSNTQFQLFNLSDWILIASVIFITIFLSTFFIKSLFSAKNNSLRFLLLWLILPLIVAFIVLYKSIATFGSTRTFIFIAPAYLVIASYGLSRLKNKNLTILLVLFCLSSIFPLNSYYLNINNSQYREVAFFLEKNIKESDVVIVNIQSVRVPFAYYSEKFEANGVSNVEDVKRIVYNKQSIWLVLSTKYADSGGLIRKYFEDNYKLDETKNFFDVVIFHYAKK